MSECKTCGGDGIKRLGVFQVFSETTGVSLRCPDCTTGRSTTDRAPTAYEYRYKPKMAPKGDEGGMTGPPSLEDILAYLDRQCARHGYTEEGLLAHAALERLRTPSAGQEIDGRNGPDGPEEGPVAEGVEALKVLRECDEYLSSNSLNSIGAGSQLHRQIKEALRPAPAEPAPVPCDSTAEVEALECGADELHLRGDFCEMAADKREWHSRAATLRNLAARLNGK